MGTSSPCLTQCARAMMRAMHPTPNTCGACRFLDPSSLAGYGWCRAGGTSLERANFLPRSAGCQWVPSRFQEEYRRAPVI